MDKYESEHNKTIERYAMLIKQLFGIALNEFAQVASIVEGDYSGNEMFNFDDYPQTMATVAKIVNTLANNMNVSVVNGCKAVWDISNMKNNALVESLFKGKDLTDEQKIRYFQNNEPALKAFTERKHNGLRLSDRVWNIVGGYKNDIETALSVSIEQGKSAHDLAKEVQRYLNEPDKLFRRVRDEFGELQLSKNAKNYHPGAGVYRSSYKNALRLARTEINMAYRTADFTRYQQLDFIVGIEIHTSGNHPVTDICDQLKGKYPKDFKFVGWHPNCRCYQTTILKTDEEMERDEALMRKGKEPSDKSVNAVNDVPDNFKEWVEDNYKYADSAKSKPYFIQDNQSYYERAKKEMTLPHVMTNEEINIIKKKFDTNITLDAYNNSAIKGADILMLDKQITEGAKSIGIDFETKKLEFEIGAESKKVSITYIGKDNLCTIKRNIYIDEETNEKIAEHKKFILSDKKDAKGDYIYQCKGFSKTILSAFYRQYKKIQDVDKITLTANHEVGGWCWARYGFCIPDKYSVLDWFTSSENFAKAKGVYNEMKKIIDDYYVPPRTKYTSFPMNLLAKELYKDVLLDSNWEGELDFNNSEQISLFEKYLKKKRK